MNSSVQKKPEPLQLVQRIMEGDREAENQLVLTYGRAVQFVLRRESRDPNAVDDLYQETFRIALEKIRSGGLRDPRKLSSFLHSTARFVTIDYFRREARHETSGIEEFELPNQERSQLSHLLLSEHGDIMRKLLAELNSERDRAILFRYYLADDDKEDICRDLDLTAIHFNRVLHRAKQRYKDIYLEAMKAETSQE